MFAISFKKLLEVSYQMTLSTRVSIQWPPELASEETHTLVITSPNDYFVDIRVYQDKYAKQEFSGAFGEVFQWCISGREVPIPNTSKIKFVHDVDSAVIVGGEKPGEPDVGDFSSIDGSDDRKETGSMKNPATGEIAPYIEIWRSLCPVQTTPTKEVREDKTQAVSVAVFDVHSDSFQGRYIRYGNWAQGVLHDKHTDEIHIVRAHNEAGSWSKLVSYGQTSRFPIEAVAEVNQTVLVDGLGWTCLESS